MLADFHARVAARGITTPTSRSGVKAYAMSVVGTASGRRADDNPETIRHRLEDYHVLTEPLLPFFRGKGVLKAVDAMAEIKQLEHDIATLMNDA